MTKIEREQYINYVETVLDNRNINTDDTQWQQHPDFKKFISGKASVLTARSIGLDAEELLIFVNAAKDSTPDTVKDLLKNTLTELNRDPQTQDYKVIDILFFVRDISTRVMLSEAFCANRKSFKDLLKAAGCKRVSVLPSVFMVKTAVTDELIIPNIKRHEILRLPPVSILPNSEPEKQHNLKGLVFTARLKDIVALYNAVGDQLFRKNVRLGISDSLQVDKSIKTTLRENPEEFWFHNNGITILVEKPDLKLNCANAIVLKPARESKLGFSVINGAQTITAAAEVFYSAGPVSSDTADNRSDPEEAQVLVRIIQIGDTKTNDRAKRISVSLNRQKPIKAEDIAFTNPFIETMNAYLETSREHYLLVRRGEEEKRAGFWSCDLVTFARAAAACAGDPGKARSAGAISLLRINEKNQFADTAVFVTDWYEEEDLHSLYCKHYKPIAAVLRLLDRYTGALRGMVLPQDEDPATVIQNGKWYFICLVLFAWNQCQDGDYTGFADHSKELTVAQCRELIDLFADFLLHSLEGKTKERVGSNLFKKSEMYRQLKKALPTSVFYQRLMELSTNSR